MKAFGGNHLFKDGMMSSIQACKLKFRLSKLTSCLCSAAASAVYFEGRMAGLDPTETGNELSQPTFEFTSLLPSDNIVCFTLWS